MKPQTAERALRNKISQVLVRNNLRTDQVAIGELLELMVEQRAAGYADARGEWNDQ